MGLDLNKLIVDNNFKFDKKLAYGIYRDRMVSFLEKGIYMIIVFVNIEPKNNKDFRRIKNLFKLIKFIDLPLVDYWLY